MDTRNLEPSTKALVAAQLATAEVTSGETYPAGQPMRLRIQQAFREYYAFLEAGAPEPEWIEY